MVTTLTSCVDFSVLPLRCQSNFFFFFFNDTATTEIYTLSLHDALPISSITSCTAKTPGSGPRGEKSSQLRSEEHTSELQSPCNLVCRLLLEKKKKETMTNPTQLRTNDSQTHSPREDRAGGRQDRQSLQS